SAFLASSNVQRSVALVCVPLSNAGASAHKRVWNQKSQKHSSRRERRMSSSPVICHQAQGLRLLPNAKKVLGAAESGRCLQLIHLLVSEAQPQRRFALRPQLL